MDDSAPESRSLEAVIEEHRDRWMEHPDVTGVGIGRCDGSPCVVLYLLRRSEDAERDLPDTVGGYPVRLEVTGRVVPRPAPDDTGGDPS